MQVEILIAGAVWFGVFYFVNKSQISRIEGLKRDAEDYTINEASVITAIHAQLKISEVDKPVDKAKFISEMFKVLEPHSIITRAEDVYKQSLYAGIGLMLISGILTFWPTTQTFQTGGYLLTKNYLILIGFVLALFLPLTTWSIQLRFNDLKESYAK